VFVVLEVAGALAAGKSLVVKVLILLVVSSKDDVDAHLAYDGDGSAVVAFVGLGGSFVFGHSEGIEDSGCCEDLCSDVHDLDLVSEHLLDPVDALGDAFGLVGGSSDAPGGLDDLIPVSVDAARFAFGDVGVCLGLFSEFSVSSHGFEESGGKVQSVPPLVSGFDVWALDSLHNA
jgi:hypothetical protein